MPFSLKIVIAVIDRGSVKTQMPASLSEVSRIREAVPVGLKESPFYMGSREMIHLFDELIDPDQDSVFEP